MFDENDKLIGVVTLSDLALAGDPRQIGDLLRAIAEPHRRRAVAADEAAQIDARSGVRLRDPHRHDGPVFGDRLRYDVVALLALLASVAVGISVPAASAFSGFGNDIVVIVASALLVSLRIVRISTLCQRTGGA